MSGTPNKIENLPLTETAPALTDWAVINRPGVQAKKVLHEKLRDLYKVYWDVDIASAVAAAVASIINYRGDYTPAGNYPSTGGSGTAGAIKKANAYIIAGLGSGVTATMGSVTVQDGDMVIAKIDSPGNTDANWTVIENNLGYVAMNKAIYDAANIAEQLVGLTAIQTLTNKRFVVRIGTEASSATSTPNIDLYDQWNVTALAASDAFAAPSGTPTDGQNLIVRIKDNGTARALTWDAIYRASSDLALPSTTVVNKTLYLGFKYNSAATKWDLIALLNNF